MNIDVARRLTHSATLEVWVSDNEAAEPIYATGAAVACFIEPVARRSLDNTGKVVVIDWDVILLGSTGVKPGDRLSTGLTPDGTTLLGSGIVVSVDDAMHPVDQRKARICAVRNAVA